MGSPVPTTTTITPLPQQPPPPHLPLTQPPTSPPPPQCSSSWLWWWRPWRWQTPPGAMETWRDSPLLSGEDTSSEDYCRYACDGKGWCITTYTGAPSSLWQTEGTCTVGEVWEECVERGECEECFNIPTTCMQCNQVVVCTGDSTEVVPHLASWR